MIAPATAPSGGVFSFPMTRSVISTKLSSGTIGPAGWLSLTQGAAALQLTNFDIWFAAQPTLAASVAGSAQKLEILNLCQGSREFPRCDHGNSPPVIALRSVLMASRWARMR